MCKIQELEKQMNTERQQAKVSAWFRQWSLVSLASVYTCYVILGLFSSDH